MKKQQTLLFAVALIALAIPVGMRMLQGEDETAPPAGAGTEPTPEPASQAPPAPHPPPAEREVPPPVDDAEPRVALPRPSRSATTPTPGQTSPAPEEELDTGFPAGGVDPDLPLSRASIQSTMADLAPQIERCLEGWMDQDPTLEGRVVLEFTIGQEGVEEAYVAEHEALPLGTLGCFSTAVWQQTWPQPTDGGVVSVSYPFVVSSDAPE